MKNKFLSVISFLLLFSILCLNITSACPIFGGDFGLSISGLKLNSNLNMDKLINLCTKENCVIDYNKKQVTIQSHYNSQVALIIFGADANNIGIYEVIPYKLNQSCENPKYCPIPDKINPNNYNWKEAVTTDLNFLKGKGILDISENDLSDITAVSTHGGEILYCEKKWQMATGEACVYTLKDVNDSSPTFGKNINIDGGQLVSTDCGGISAELLVLPLKGFSISNNNGNSYLIYYILALIVIVLIILFLIFRKRK
jgi:hypothetical protein